MSMENVWSCEVQVLKTSIYGYGPMDDTGVFDICIIEFGCSN
jgi:hypothetical protein